MRLLVGEDFSPWTEKACWALDHHGVRYTFEQYPPLLGEPWLRLRSRTLRGRVTVPMLLEGRTVLRDSYAIARHAEALGGGAPLWPAGREAEVEAWNARSERALRAGRALFFARLLRDPAAQLEQVPPFVPRALRPLLRPAVRSGVAWLRAKHGAGPGFTAEATAVLDAELGALRAALAGGRYVLGVLSYADVCMAVVCQFVRPVDAPHMPLAPANRACWTAPELVARHQDLLAWRDALYAEHRRRG